MGKKLRFRGAKNGKVGVSEPNSIFSNLGNFSKFLPKTDRIIHIRLIGSSFDKFYDAPCPLADFRSPRRLCGKGQFGQY